MKVAIVIGHKKSSRGSSNKKLNLTEFEFNKKIAECIKQFSMTAIEIVYRELYRDLPGKINKLKPDFIISLHCNAFNKKASGTETLFYYSSNKSKVLAGILQGNIVSALGLPDRGIKSKGSEDRGGYLLRYTHSPCVIAEPFFIDNDSDLSRAKERQDTLVSAYIDTINKYVKHLEG